MNTELLAWLINATIATSFACIVVAMSRRPLQRSLGTEVGFRLWSAVPLAAIAACFSLPQHAESAGEVASGVQGKAYTALLAVQVTHALSGVAADRWLLAIWLAGAAVLSLVFVWQQRRYVARLQLRLSEDGSWRSARPGATPAVLGLLHQKLVLPDGFEASYNDEERQLVIAHERMHQRRRDPWALATCALLRTLFWFNPIVHLSALLFRRDVELACDAAVLRVYPHSRRRYADALFKAELADGATPIGCHWHLVPPMKERIMLLTQAMPTRYARLAGAIAIAIAALGTAGIALAGHDTAMNAASALAASSPSSLGGATTFYKVNLKVQADAPGSVAGNTHSVNRNSMAETLVLRAGETATIKTDGHGHGPAWGMRFHVDPNPGSNGVVLSGDLFTHNEAHVVGHARLAQTPGRPLEIAMKDASTGTAYRIDAQVAPAAIPPPPAPPVAPTSLPPMMAPEPPAPPPMTAPLPPPTPRAPMAVQAPPPPPLRAPVPPRSALVAPPAVPAPPQMLAPLPPTPPLAPLPPVAVTDVRHSVRTTPQAAPPRPETLMAPPAPVETPEADAVAPPVSSGH